MGIDRDERRPPGLLKKSVLFCLILPTEHLIVLVHDTFERGCVHMFVDHYQYHANEGVWCLGEEKLLKVVPPVRTLVPH